MNSLFPSTSLFLFKEPAREACCQRSHKEGFVPVFSWMFGTGLCRLGNGWSCAPGASSRRKGAEKFSNSQQAAGFFSPGLGNLLELSEADAGPCDSPWCEVLHDAPKHKPHPQTSLGAVPALEGALGSPVPTLQAEPLPQAGFFVSPGGACPGWAVPKPRDSFPVLHQSWRCLPTGNHNFSWAAISW